MHMDIEKLFYNLKKYEFINLPGPMYLDDVGNFQYYDEKAEYVEHDPIIWDQCLSEKSNLIILLHGAHCGNYWVECLDGIERPILSYLDENTFQKLICYDDDFMAVLIRRKQKTLFYQFGILGGFDGLFTSFSENPLHPDIQKMTIETIESNV